MALGIGFAIVIVIVLTKVALRTERKAEYYRDRADRGLSVPTPRLPVRTKATHCCQCEVEANRRPPMAWVVQQANRMRSSH